MPVWVGYIVGLLEIAGGVVLIIVGQQTAGLALIGAGCGQLGIHKYTP